MSPRRRISARLAGSALTFKRSISRSTWFSSLRSVTLMTSISLCSCLITCSMMKASPRTTRVMRDTEGSSVSPTDRLSMLYPRAEKSPATRERTPNLFSTMTAIVCFSGSDVTSTSLLLPDSGGLAAPVLETCLGLGRLFLHLSAGRGQDHILVGAARRHHGVHALVLVDAHVEHDGRRRADHLLDGRHHLARLGDPNSHTAIRLRQSHVVGHARQVDGEEALLVDDPLPLAHHPVPAVVDDHRFDREPLADARGELLAVHLEGSVAIDVDHELVGVRRLNPHRRGEAIAHGAEPARGAPAPRMLETIVLRGPHLVLPHARDHEGFALRQVRELLNHVLRLDDVVALLV